MLKKDEDVYINMETLYDIERMIVSDFYGCAEDINKKVNSFSGEVSFFLGMTMLRIKKLEEKR